MESYFYKRRLLLKFIGVLSLGNFSLFDVKNAKAHIIDGDENFKPKIDSQNLKFQSDPLLSMLNKAVGLSKDFSQQTEINNTSFCKLIHETVNIVYNSLDSENGDFTFSNLRKKTDELSIPLVPYLFDSHVGISDKMIELSFKNNELNSNFSYKTPEGVVDIFMDLKSTKIKFLELNKLISAIVKFTISLEGNSKTDFFINLLLSPVIINGRNQISFNIAKFPKFYNSISHSGTLEVGEVKDPFLAFPILNNKEYKLHLIKELDSAINKLTYKLPSIDSPLLNLSNNTTLLIFQENQILILSKELKSDKTQSLLTSSKPAHIELYIYNELLLVKLKSYINGILPKGKIRSLSIDTEGILEKVAVLKGSFTHNEERGLGDFADIDISIKVDFKYQMFLRPRGSSVLEFNARMLKYNIDVKVEDAPTDAIAESISNEVLKTVESQMKTSLSSLQEFISLQDFDSQHIATNISKDGLLVKINV